MDSTFRPTEMYFILENVFNYFHTQNGVDGFWWRECAGSNEGYVMVWFGDDGLTTEHTYRYPPDIYRS